MKINLTKKNIEAIEQAQRHIYMGQMYLNSNYVIDELEKILNKWKKETE